MEPYSSAQEMFTKNAYEHIIEKNYYLFFLLFFKRLNFTKNTIATRSSQALEER